MTKVSTKRISTIFTLGLMVTVTAGEWTKTYSLRCLCGSNKDGALLLISRFVSKTSEQLTRLAVKLPWRGKARLGEILLVDTAVVVFVAYNCHSSPRAFDKYSLTSKGHELLVSGLVSSLVWAVSPRLSLMTFAS
jgi:hypothetical protein